MRFSTGLLLLASLAFSEACRSTPVNPTTVATGFVAALNSKDVGAMSKLSTTPFRYRNQDWESAADGSGFVRGKSTERVATNLDDLQAMLRDIASRVAVDDPAAVTNPPSKAELMKAMLGGGPEWANLDLVVFKRGEGDVEHVAIIGVDGGSGKVTGLYIN